MRRSNGLEVCNVVHLRFCCFLLWVVRVDLESKSMTEREVVLDWTSMTTYQAWWSSRMESTSWDERTWIRTWDRRPSRLQSESCLNVLARGNVQGLASGLVEEHRLSCPRERGSHQIRCMVKVLFVVRQLRAVSVVSARG